MLKKVLKIIIIITLIITILTTVTCIIISECIKGSVDDRILSFDKATELKNVDCILILGCGVKEDGTPSLMLSDRMTVGMDLYKSKAAPKILVSGDHGTVEYDEVNTMKQIAIDNGIPSEDVFMDHAGFNTYDSMYRARDVFKVKKVIIVTQEFHLSRALYIAESMGLEAYGVAADLREYSGEWLNELREIAARTKDYFVTLFELDPVCLGEPIPISGNGDLTNDK